MSITIYALGDGAYMAKVLNGIAMFPDYALWGSLGAMFAIVIVALRSVMSREFELHWLLISWVLFMLMFNIRVDKVMISEVNPHLGATGTEQYVVDNVPFGAVMGGAIISNMGMALATRLDQVFGGVQGSSRLSTGGIGHDLKILANMRQLAHPMAMDPAGVLPTFRKSLAQYIQDCTRTGVNNGTVDLAKIYQGGDVIEAIAFRNNLITTTYFSKETPAGEQLTCTAAHAKISELTKSDAIVRAVNEAALAIGPAKKEGGSETVGSRWSWLSKPESGPDHGVVGNTVDVFAAYGKPVADNGRQMVAASMLMNLHVGALLSGGKLDSSDVANIVMVEEAAMARNTQAAAEENLFVRYMRPTISFFESWFFAMVPIMSFLVMLGKFGWQMVSKYAMFTMSVALYFPILSIISLYGDTQMEHYFTAMSNVENIQSMAGIQQLSMQAQDAVGFTATMVAATPMLVLMILYGTPTVASFLANRLAGGDHVAETTVAPQAMSIGAITQAGASTSYSEVSGNNKQDADKVDPKLSYGHVMSTVESSARSELQSSQAAYSHSVAQGVSLLTQTGHASNIGVGSTDGRVAKEDIGHGLNQTNANSIGAKQGQDVSHTEGTSTRDAEIDAAKYSIAGKLGLAGGGSGGNVGFDASHTNLTEVANTTGFNTSNTNGLDQAQTMQFNQSLQAGNDVAHALQTMSTDQTIDSSMRTQAANLAEQIQKSEQDVIAASHAYQMVQSDAKAHGYTESLSASQVAQNNIRAWEIEAHSKGLTGSAANDYIETKINGVIDKVQGLGLGTEFDRQYDKAHYVIGDARLDNVHGMNGQADHDATKSLVAAIVTLTGGGSSDAIKDIVTTRDSDLKDDYAGLVSNLMRDGFSSAAPVPDPSGASEFKGVGKDVHFGEVKEKAENLHGPGFTAADVNARAGAIESAAAQHYQSTETERAYLASNTHRFSPEQQQEVNAGAMKQVLDINDRLNDRSHRLTNEERAEMSTKMSQILVSLYDKVGRGDYTLNQALKDIEVANGGHGSHRVLSEREYGNAPFNGMRGDIVDVLKTALNGNGVPDPAYLAKLQRNVEREIEGGSDAIPIHKVREMVDHTFNNTSDSKAKFVGPQEGQVVGNSDLRDSSGNAKPPSK